MWLFFENVYSVTLMQRIVIHNSVKNIIYNLALSFVIIVNVSQNCFVIFIFIFI